jgi:hypothetical protein
MACALAADLLHLNTQRKSWLLARIDHLEKDDHRRVLAGFSELVEELTRRAETPLGGKQSTQPVYDEENEAS